MLTLKNIKKDYVAGTQVVHAIKDLSVNFRQSEFVSILGASGCGKTTLLNIIGGLDKYTSGDLVIDGRSTKDYKDKDWDAYRNASIGFVFQNYNLIPHLSVLNNVELALSLSGVSAAERKRRATESLSKVGLADQLNKKPNQLSGGQMQRVAIARALVNDPEILLADEPTGALDSETSISVMELIKEISKDRLVIMVTHNPEIATDYSTRIIKLKDGEILEDSNPYKLPKQQKPAQNKTRRTAMSYGTALSLSFKNLITKKGKTILTAFAGSIGIIGVALILAISSGLNSYIARMQSETLASYPITIYESSIDMTSMMSGQSADILEAYPELEELLVQAQADYSAMYYTNTLDQTYSDFLSTLDSSIVADIVYNYNMSLNVYKQDASGIYVEMNTINAYEGTTAEQMGLSTSAWQKMINNTDYILEQYDVIDGEMATSANEIVLVVDEYNQISYEYLSSLGLVSDTSTTSIDFDDLIGQTYTVVLNDDLYSFNDTYYEINDINSITLNNTIELEIVGILRPKEDANASLLSTGIAYTSVLETAIIEANSGSEITKFVLDNPTIYPFSGETYIALNTDADADNNQYYTSVLRLLGGATTPYSIEIYAVDFNSKDDIMTALDGYNASVDDESMQVIYTDIFGTMSDSLTLLVNVISYVLIGFSSISLIVSSIMIGIITYTSVVERTKEIGVLRSIGARKKDITRVFNSETLLIGLTSGILGVGITMLLTIPINALIVALAGNIGFTAALGIPTILILVAISAGLTLIAGLIPAKIASKKDPVIALRS